MEKLNESVKNLLEPNDDKLKIKYTDQVWDILQESYKSQGGIKGNGFKTKQDMLNIPFWKLDIIDEKVLCVLMYKYTPVDTIDGNVRKLCALGIVSDEDKNIARIKLKNILKIEFTRSIMEVSGLLESYLLKNFPIEYKKFMLTTDEVEKILFLDEITPIDKNRYYRNIGNEPHEKVMLGTRNIKY
jgi:hypothetical protein